MINALIHSLVHGESFQNALTLAVQLLLLINAGNAQTYMIAQEPRTYATLMYANAVQVTPPANLLIITAMVGLASPALKTANALAQNPIVSPTNAKDAN